MVIYVRGRLSVVALKPYTSKTASEIAKIEGLSVPLIIYSLAIERGFDPIHRKIAKEPIQDSPRSSRPTKQDPETINTTLEKMHLDRFGREKSFADLTGDLSKEGIES